MMEKTEIYAPTDMRMRANRLMAAWFELPGGSEITVKSGQLQEGDPAILVLLEDDPHIFTTEEARVIIGSIKETMEVAPHPQRTAGLLMLIDALQEGVDVAERKRMALQ